jgi:hypothetical protein
MEGKERKDKLLLFSSVSLSITVETIEKANDI